ncbi:MAG: TIGR00730 family Rossman fold protein [Geminicoccaceae bacterium]
MIKSLCIFCRSRHGAIPEYRVQAARLGELCGNHAIEVVYGGGHVGLMGVVADAAMAAGGTVTGLIPERLLKREVGHRAISELIVTESMFDRKDQMITRSDAFAILPGGLGTLDELFEVLTLRQLGYHQKPIILININSFWDPLCALMGRVADGAFADPDTSSMLHTVEDVDAVLPALGIGKTEAA